MKETLIKLKNLKISKKCLVEKSEPTILYRLYTLKMKRSEKLYSFEKTKNLVL